jgi:hypothetical protein
MPLFELTVSNPDPRFEIVRTHPSKVIAKQAMEEVFTTFTDPDGNFIEQFQSTGFDARVFELYLHAALKERGMVIERPDAPDFLLESRGTRFALEATTSNPSTSGTLKEYGTRLGQLDVPARLQYLKDEWPVRMGGPLSAKLRKRYWEKPHCKGLPLVIAIEAFHDSQAIFLSHVGFQTYLYGRALVEPRIIKGRLAANVSSITTHTVGPKTIPSHFFGQPEAEHISAVIFSNTGTGGKFTRMGYPRFGHAATTGVVRVGALRNPHPEVRHASLFMYDLRAPLLHEKWSDGMVVMHNPNAAVPLPLDVFEGVAQVWGHECNEDLPDRHIYVSHTWPEGPERPFQPLVIEGCARGEGRSLAAIPLPDNVTTEYWFSDPSRRCLGVVTQDEEEPDIWRAWRLLQAEDGLFYPTGSRVFAYDQEAVDYIQEWLAAVLFRGTPAAQSLKWVPRLFPQIFLEAAEAKDASAPASDLGDSTPEAPANREDSKTRSAPD